MPWRVVNVLTTVRELAPYNPKRTALVIQNADSDAVHVSGDQTTVTTLGWRLVEDSIMRLTIEQGDEPWLPLYAQRVSGDGEVKVYEGFGLPSEEEV